MTTASDLPDSSSADGPDSIVELHDVTKVFPGVTALDGVTLAVRRGEVHGLIGENGAGKSTMMKVLSGLEQPTSGRLLIDGQPVELRHPVDAMRHGVAMIHQELNLVDELSAAENIFLGRERRRGPLIDRRRTVADAAEILDSLGVAISPEAPVRTLSIAQQQLVEVAKALSQKARLLIMDEPTAVLTARETTLLFALVDRLRADGTTIVYISHILSEVRQICDRITVLRDGQVVSTLDASVEELTDHRLASLMVGRPMADHFPPPGRPEPEVVLRIEEVDVPTRVHGVSLDVRRGEVMGLAGLVGAGRTELGEAIAGLRPRSGTVSVQGRSLPAGQPRAAVGSGLCYVSEDRKGRGLSLGLSIASNVTLPSIDRHCRPMLSHRRERRAATAQCDRLQVRRSSVAQPIESLSGGNQQKVSLARWLELEPIVLVLDEPTRGVDIGAKEEIYRVVRSLTERGMTCLMISSEMNELLGMCDRIAVMRAGRLVAVLDRQDATDERIMRLAAGVEEPDS